MNPLLSVVIPVLDDPAIEHTIESIRQTAPSAEIVVVNDASTNIDLFGIGAIPNVVVVSNSLRCGSGPCRHIGALHASGQWLLHTDAHMHFYKGWYEAFWAEVPPGKIKDATKQPGQWEFETEKLVLCGTMIALEEDNSVHGSYTGATLNLIGPDPGGNKMQVFEANWLKTIPQHMSEIPCVMGACYFVPRDWYLYLSPHRFLRSWGKEEEMLSVKTYLAGGSVRYLETVEIGHVFRGKQPPPYAIPPEDLLYNKLFAIRTLTSGIMTEALLALINKLEPMKLTNKARQMIHDDWHIIQTEMATMPREVSFAEYCRKFSIPIP